MKKSKYSIPEIFIIPQISILDIITLSNGGKENGGDEYGPLKPMD